MCLKMNCLHVLPRPTVGDGNNKNRSVRGVDNSHCWKIEEKKPHNSECVMPFSHSHCTSCLSRLARTGVGRCTHKISFPFFFFFICMHYIEFPFLKEHTWHVSMSDATFLIIISVNIWHISNLCNQWRKNSTSNVYANRILPFQQFSTNPPKFMRHQKTIVQANKVKTKNYSLVEEINFLWFFCDLWANIRKQMDSNLIKSMLCK